MAEGYVETNGVRLWYEERGDAAGEAVVLIMGAMASATAWPDVLLDALAEGGRRVVRFDNRDIGLSTHIDYATTPYSLEDMATDTLGMMDTLGIDRAHLIGASMGGMISQVIALRAPERVRSLGLLITSPGPDERLSPSSDELIAIAVREATTDEEVAQRGVDLWRFLTGSRFPFDEAATRERADADAARGTNANSAHSIAVFTAPSRVDALGAIEVPTLIVQGAEDPVFPIDHGETMAKAIPGATLVVWDGVGHEIPEPLGPELIELLQRHVASA